ncbi:MAG: hypothetical protein LCH91_14160 [Bacteroidetes bacterium]|nr:hypothetical protein [Bacteroidota bacterium]
MITVSVSPPTLGLTKDPLVYSFQSDDYKGAMGAIAINRLYFAGPIMSGTVVQLLWNGVVTTLTAAALPLPNGTQFKSGAGGSNAYANQVLPYFQGNAAIAKDFNVTVENAYLIFTAKTKGKAYNITPVAVPGVWGVQNTTQGADEINRENHCINLQLFFERVSGIGQDKIYEVYLPTDENGKAEIDLADVLNSKLQTQIEQPFWTGATPKISRATSRKYQVTVSEAYGRPLKNGLISVLAEQRVMWGGSGYNQQNTVGARMWQSGKMVALRNGTALRYIMKDEPQWLTFVCLDAYIMDLLFKMDVLWDDNTTGTYTIAPLNQVNNGEKIILPAGFSQLNVNSYSAGKKAKQYTLYLKAGATEKSLRYTYVIDTNLRDKRKYFVYFNSLGAWDSLKVNGVEDRTIELKTRSASRRLAYPQVQGDSEQSDYYGSYDQIFSCTTSWLSRDEQKNVRDFFVSPQKYRYFNGSIFPVGVTSSKLSEQDDDETMLFYKFEYKFLFTNDAFLQ